jgi:hypothetical protein
MYVQLHAHFPSYPFLGGVVVGNSLLFMAGGFGCVPGPFYGLL